MNTMKIVAAAAVITGLMAGPVLAKDQMNRRAKTSHMQNTEMTDNGYRNDVRYRNDANSRNGAYSRNTGFWPAEVAAGAVGGAIGVAGAAVNTAGAIATAPFRPWNNSYAQYNGYDGYDQRDSYARRNGFVCQPGTVFQGEDGRPHLCQ